jgi:protease IV
MRPFFKQTLASTLGSVLGLTIFSGLSLLTLLAIFIGFTSSLSKNDLPVVRDKTVLVLDLSAGIIDRDPGASLEDALTGKAQKSLTVRAATQAIRTASQDRKIVALYLDGGSGGSGSSGLAGLQEVRAALSDFRQAGKPIYAYDADFSHTNYFLASVANTIVLSPPGSLDLNGFRQERMFYKGALEKYGIGAEIIRVGKYKSAYEAYSQTGFSPESRQENQAVLNSLWTDFKTTIGSHRQISPTTIQTIADTQGTLSAKEALNQKLIDKILYPDRVKAELAQLGEADQVKGFRQISMTDYQAVIAPELTAEPKVAVLYAQGAIVSGSGESGQIGADSFAATVAGLRDDKEIAAVVLRVNSPGGSAAASDMLQRELKLLAEKKPLIVSMGNMAASGGYYISTNAQRIFAQPTTITGSIGVIGMNWNFQKLARDQGVTWDVVKTAKLADSATIARPKTKEELAIAQKFVNQVYDDFLDRVAEGRKIPKAKVNEIAQGRIWSGTEAQKIGLVDELGGLEKAIAHAATQAKLGKNWQVVEYPDATSFSAQLIKRLSGAEVAQLRQGSAASSSLLSQELQKLQADLAEMQTFNDPRGIYARMNFSFNLD